MPQKTLNLLPAEIKKYQEILSAYEKIEAKEEFILYRTKIGMSMVTLYEGKKAGGKLLIQGPDCEDVFDRLHSKLDVQGLAIGIDEAGRGEKTGPFVVAGILGDRNDFRQVRDSKKTTDIAARYTEVVSSAKDVFIKEVEASEIDHFRSSGKTMDALQVQLMDEIVPILRKGEDIPVLIDGSPLPVNFTNVEFIPQGDDKDPLISAASILARHARDVSSDKGVRKTWKEKLKKKKPLKKSN